MKMKLKGLIFLALLYGCSLEQETVYIETPITEHVDIITDSFYYVHETIKYKPEDSGWFEHWQSPEETLRLGTGDCEDYCILFMFYTTEFNPLMLHVSVGVEQNISGHYITQIDNLWYDPTAGIIATKEFFIDRMFYSEPNFIYTWTDILKRIKVD